MTKKKKEKQVSYKLKCSKCKEWFEVYNRNRSVCDKCRGY